MGEGASSKLKRAARKVLVAACGSFSSSSSRKPPPALADPAASFDTSLNILGCREMSPRKQEEHLKEEEEAEFNIISHENNVASKNMCAICLESLSYKTGSRKGGPAIFTAQCSHAFHFSCISSNVRHGSVTCPICRAHWTQLPRNIDPPACALSQNQTDPVFRILDDSIATFRFHRRSFLRSARYDDDDPIEINNTATTSHDHSRLFFSLLPAIVPPPPKFPFHHLQHYHYHRHHARDPSGSSLFLPQLPTCHSLYWRSASGNPAYLSVKLSHRHAMDLVLVASPNGPHLRLIKQSMALVVFSLRPIDRLSIVTYSSSAARAFPLRRMTSFGKRAALQVIDRLFYSGQADPSEGLKKGVKILEDRTHKNPESFILHLSDCPTRTVSYNHIAANTQAPILIHPFHLGFGFGTSNGFIMHEFEEFLAELLGGVIRDVQLRIGEDGRVMRLGDMRGTEERKLLLELGDCEHLCIGYSYFEGGGEATSGETVVSVGDKKRSPESEAPRNDTNAGCDREADLVNSNIIIMGGRTSSVESWGYHDPFMARRWAKHLHGYRL